MEDILKRIENNRNVLKKKFYFQVAVLFISMTVIIACSIGFLSDGMFNIITGLFISLLVWSITDIYSLFLSTFTEYKDQEKKFLKGIYSYLKNFTNAKDKILSDKVNNQIVNKLKDNESEEANIFWHDMLELSNSLISYFSRCTIEYPYYTMNDNFIKLSQYNWKLFWILSANLYNNRCDTENLFNRFIDIHSATVPQNFNDVFSEFDKTVHSTAAAYKEMKSMKLDDEYFEPPCAVFGIEDWSAMYIGSIYEFGNGKSEKRTTLIRYKPIDDIMKYTTLDESMTEKNCIFRLIHSRLYDFIKNSNRDIKGNLTR